MNIKSKKIMSMMIIAVLVIIGAPHLSQAGLQANKGGTRLTNITSNNFFIAIRKMETQYGTLGKNAILDTTTYIDSVENGIDSHMILNTEFGTIGILAYSEYGNKPNSTDNSTTKNESGVYNLINGYKAVSGIFSSTNNYTNIIGNADSRYYNKYAYSTSIAGDGMGIFGQSATYPTAQYPTFIRKGIFGADSDNWGGYGSGVGCGSSNISTYAVVVCGTDI